MVPAPTPARSATSGTVVPWKPRLTNRSSAASRITSRLSAGTTPRTGRGPAGDGGGGGGGGGGGVIVLRNEYSFRSGDASEIRTPGADSAHGAHAAATTGAERRKLPAPRSRTE